VSTVRKLGEVAQQFKANSRTQIYSNPSGGFKQCLNSKIASCRLQLRDKASGTIEMLETNNRAAFEILTDDHDHGIELAA